MTMFNAGTEPNGACLTDASTTLTQADGAHPVSPALIRRTATRLLTAVLLATMVVAACGDDGTTSASIRPFDDVRASGMTFEADPADPSRAIFRVTTTEPMICAIVWGTDDSYGRFNNSLAMNGTGIEQHDVSLPDVVVGVTYRYIVQGTTADGTLYRSAPATFQIDDRATAPSGTAITPGRNIATKATVTSVSSEFSAAFAAAKAIDDDTKTEWASRGDGDNGSITLDLGDTTDVRGVEFVTRSMADGSAVTSSYSVTIDDRATFGPFPAATLRTPRPALFTARGRVLRIDIATSSGGNVGAVEIRVYA